MNFTDKEKIEAFDEIAKHFFNVNLTQFSKSDFDLLMFTIYIRKAQSPDCNGSKNCSDYEISKALGITPSQVRNFKVKSQLIYPEKRDWEKEFGTLIGNARYDKSSGKIIISIDDPNLYLYIQNLVESRGAYIEKQLNSKLLQMRVEYFIDLAVSLEPEGKRKEIIKELRKQIKSSGKDDSLFDDNHVGKSLLDISVNLSTVAANISGLFSGTNLIGDGLRHLFWR